MALGSSSWAQWYPTTQARFPIPEQLGLGYAINGGAAIALKSDLQRQASPMFGVSWFGPADSTFNNQAAIGLSIDWTPIERFDGKNVSYVPILFNYREYGDIGGYRVSVTLGVGVLGLSDDIPVMQLQKGASFGWSGGVGIDISNTLNGLFRFIGGENPGDDGLVTLQLGYRF